MITNPLRTAGLLAALSGLWTVTAGAADLSRCVGIAAAGARLACYDRVAEADIPAPPIQDHWQFSQRPAEHNGYTNVFLMTTGQGNRRRTPTLYLRCKENVSAAIIDWRTTIGTQSVTVRYRVDDGPERRRTWRPATSHQATGLFIGRESIPFIKSLFGGRRLVAEVDSPTEGTVTATFDIRGLEKAIEPLREACHW